MDMIDIPAMDVLEIISEQMERFGFGEGEDLSEYEDMFEELGV